MSPLIPLLYRMTLFSLAIVLEILQKQKIVIMIGCDADSRYNNENQLIALRQGIIFVPSIIHEEPDMRSVSYHMYVDDLTVKGMIP